MWPNLSITQLLGIKHPIIQAPMADYATSRLAAEVSNAGGLGSLGCGEMTVDEFIQTFKEVTEKTTKPINFNFMAHQEPISNSQTNIIVSESMESYYKERGLALPQDIRAPFPAFNDSIVNALIELKPKVVSFHFGLPSQDAVNLIQQSGCKILCSATSVEEALALEKAGIDAIIAQGWEAGGHRGSFDVNDPGIGTGTMALVPQIVDQVKIPVIAAGGIADGRGLVAAMILGAAGVQLGTAFLLCPEAQVSEVHRHAIRNSKDNHTRLTMGISGRPARTARTRYVEDHSAERFETLDYPLMYNFTEPLIESSQQNGDKNHLFLPFGQASALSKELPAAQLIQHLVDESYSILDKNFK